MNGWRDAPTLVGRHATLRPLDRDDRSAILAAFARGLDHVFTIPPPSEATIDDWFDQIEAQRTVGRAMPFTVLDRGGDVVGVTRFLRMNEAHRRTEIGGTIYAARVQRTGLNTDAKRLLLGHAFEVLGCRCVQIRTDYLNRRSRTAIERLGAKLDGLLRAHSSMEDGRVRDLLVYSILDHEWPGVRRNLEAMLDEGVGRR